MALDDVTGSAENQSLWDSVEDAIIMQSGDMKKINELLQEISPMSTVVGNVGDEWFALAPIHGTEPFVSYVLEAFKAEIGAVQDTSYDGNLAYLLSGEPGESVTLNIGAVPVQVNMARKPELEPDKMDLDNLSIYRPVQRKGEIISLEMSSDTAEQGFLPVSDGVRNQFPGYNIPFTITSGITGSWDTHVSSASEGTRNGALAGNQIAHNMEGFFQMHSNAQPGMHVNFKVVEPGKVYALTRISEQPSFYATGR
ncbi:hypothetical protein ACFL1B_02595 [Nanoarchaeota archaeon]